MKKYPPYVHASACLLGLGIATFLGDNLGLFSVPWPAFFLAAGALVLGGSGIAHFYLREWGLLP